MKNVTEYAKLFEIPFELEKNIAKDGWKPTEDMIDEEFISREDYEAMLHDYNVANEKVIFSNTYLEWDSCDCGDGYGCSHGSWIYSLSIINDGKRMEADIEDGEYLMIENGKKGDDYRCISLPIDSISIGDFYRACQLMGIELEFTEYGQSILTAPSELKQQRDELLEALKHIMPNMEAYGTAYHKDDGRWFKRIFSKEIELIQKLSNENT